MIILSVWESANPQIRAVVEVKHSFGAKDHNRLQALKRGVEQVAFLTLRHWDFITPIGGKRPMILISNFTDLPPRVTCLLPPDAMSRVRFIYGYAPDNTAINFSTSNFTRGGTDFFAVTQDNPQTDKMIKLLSGDL